MFNFYTPWERQKTFDCLTFSGVTEMEHWDKICSTWLWLKSLFLLDFLFKNISSTYDRTTGDRIWEAHCNLKVPFDSLTENYWIGNQTELYKDFQFTCSNNNGVLSGIWGSYTNGDRKYDFSCATFSFKKKIVIQVISQMLACHGLKLSQKICTWQELTASMITTLSKFVVSFKGTFYCKICWIFCFNKNFETILKFSTSEVYSEPCLTSMMVRFVKEVKDFWPLTIFSKRFILDVWQGSEYAYGFYDPLTYL